MPVIAEPSIGNVPPSPIGRPVTPAMRAFFAALPKAELHCHLLGAVRRETMAALAARHRASVTAAEIDAFYDRGERPVGVLHVLRTLERQLLLHPDDFHRITYEYLADAAREGVVHAEVFWNPTGSLRHAHLSYPAMQGAIVAAMREAEADHGVTALLIPSIDREAEPAAAVAMVEAMLAARDDRVPGIGIDYREVDRPPELFADAFALARRAGLRATAHAGEFGMPWRNVATVVDLLGVDRVDHGYTIVDNPDLARRYAERGLVFTVVPTNSYYLRTLPRERWATGHPIRRMAELGLRLHPNTDDPTLHRVSPGGAWELMWSHLGFDRPALRAAMLAGIDAAWADAGVKAHWAHDWTARFDALQPAASVCDPPPGTYG